MPPEVREKAKVYLRQVEQAILEEVNQRRLPHGIFPALRPCNFLCVLTQKYLHAVFTVDNAGQLPLQVWIDSREKPIPTDPEYEFVQTLAAYQLGFKNFSPFYEDAAILDAATDKQRDSAGIAGREYVDMVMQQLTRPKTIAGYEGLQPALDVFSTDHPHIEKNVFMSMPFRENDHFEEIDKAIRSGLERYGLIGHRSDDRMYAPDGDVWNNVCVYMFGCRYAICVFEDIDRRDFNPNVAIEYGFLRAMDRRILLLKEQRLPTMPSDMVGKLYRPFDALKITSTIYARLSEWTERDLRLTAIASQGAV